MVAYSGAMANPEHLAMLKQGVRVWNNWIQRTREEHWQQHSGSYASKTTFTPDLTGAGLRKESLINVDMSEVLLNGADLHGANLTRARLIRSSLRNADLSADLYHADLSGADLTGANLTSAYIVGATLREADLSEANLWGANLRDADVRGANMRCSNMTQARLEETIFGGTNLKGAKGLESCTHIGPSTIDHRTLYMSGPLPLTFLRGCGLPDQLIDYLPSLLTTPIQFYSCFISLQYTGPAICGAPLCRSTEQRGQVLVCST